MARPNQRRSNGRTQVASSDQYYNLSVHAPSQVRAQSKSANQAFALSDALGFTQKIAGEQIKKAQDKAVLFGEKAALEGRDLSPEEAKRDAVFYGHTRVKTQRASIEMQQAVRDAYQKSANKGDPAALATELDEVYRASFGGIDMESSLGREMFKIAAPAYKEVLKEVDDANATETAKQIQADLEDDFTVLAGDQYARTGGIDWQALNDQMKDAGVPASRINSVLAATARDLAERNGDVSVIDSLPTTWKNNAGGPAAATNLKDGLRNSRRAAENQAKTNGALNNADAKAAHAKWESDVERAVMDNIMSGHNMTETIQTLLRSNLDSGKAATLIRFQKQWEDGLDTDEEVDQDRLSQIILEISNRNYAQEDLNADIGSGALGSGEELTKNIASIQQQMRTVATAQRNTAEYSAIQKSLSASYTADAYTERNVPDSSRYRAAAMRLWVELQMPDRSVVGPTGEERHEPGMSALEAEQEVLRRMPPRDFNASAAATPEARIKGYADRAHSARDVMSLKPAGMTNDAYLIDLMQFTDAETIQRLRKEIQ